MLCTIIQEVTPEVTRPKTPTQFNAFDQVFINSSPPNAVALQKANELLNSTIKDCTTVSTPIRQYIRKSTTRAKQLQAHTIVHQHNANNLRSIIKKHTTRKKGKRVVLKGHFHISTQELCNVVVQAEKETKKQVKGKGKKKGKAIIYKTESDKDEEEEAEDQIETNTEDYIIIYIE